MQCSGVPETFAVSYAAKRCGKSRQPFGCVHAISFIKFNLNSFIHDSNLLGLICFGSVRYFRYFSKGSGLCKVKEDETLSFEHAF